MSDENDFLIRKIDSTDPYSSSANQQRKKSRKRFKKKSTEEAGSHFEELSLLAEHSHALLRKADSPYRFCIYREGSEVFIDLVRLDVEGKIEKMIRNNITRAEFSDIITRIERLDGFLVDFKA